MLWLSIYQTMSLSPQRISWKETRCLVGRVVHVHGNFSHFFIFENLFENENERDMWMAGRCLARREEMIMFGRDGADELELGTRTPCKIMEKYMQFIFGNIIAPEILQFR